MWRPLTRCNWSSAMPALRVRRQPNTAAPPNANAGPDQNSGRGRTVRVNGSASFDPNPTPLALNYRWTFASLPSGSGLTNAAIANATSAAAQFTPDIAGDYALSLVVSKANGSSAPALSTVHAFSGDIPPNADAGANQFVRPGAV